MQTKNTHTKIIATLLAFLIFFSSIGFSMDVHFCMGGVESVAFFGNDATCDMMEKNTNHCSKEKRNSHCQKMTKKTKNDCCSNENISLEKIDIAPKIVLNSFISQHLSFLTFFVIPDFLLSNTQNTFIVDLSNYNPPPLLNSEDIPVFFQVFRI